MIVGIHSENPSADRSKFVKCEVQTPLLYGQFPDFFWVNRKVMTMLIWAKPWRRDSLIVLLRYDFSRRIVKMNDQL